MSNYQPLKLIEDATVALGKLFARIRHDDLDTLTDDIQVISQQIQSACQLDQDASLSTLLVKTQTHAYSIYHSIDSAIICEHLSQQLNWSDEKRQSLISAALTMNIGMISLQNELLKQKGQISNTQKQAVNKHPELGVSLLKQAKITDSNWLDFVHQHHEHMNGSGYPQQLKGKQIIDGASLLCLADIFTAMISPRVHRHGLPSDQVTRDIFLKHGNQIDVKYAEAFIQKIGIYLPGSFVELDNGEVGIVVRHGIKAKQPTIFIVKNKQGEFYPEAQPNHKNQIIVHGLATSPDLISHTDPYKLWQTSPYQSAKKTPSNHEDDILDIVSPEIAKILCPQKLPLFPGQDILQNTKKIFQKTPLPKLSSTAIHINELLNQARPNIDQVLSLVQQDSLMSNSLIDFANSGKSNNGTNTVVMDIYDAMEIIDYHEFNYINLESLIKQILFPDEQKYELENFIEEARLSAKIMLNIASYIDGINHFDVHAAGLFYNLGMMVLAQQDPKYLNALDNARENRKYFPDFEQSYNQSSHTLIGYMLAKSIKLSEDVCLSIYHHHDVSCLNIPYINVRLLIAMLKYTQHLINTLVLCKNDFVEWEESEEEVFKELLLTEDTRKEIENNIAEIEADL
jgi:HD-GYP domain-containing protein (c-di-GMP phosphodiesterase class II)